MSLSQARRTAEATQPQVQPEAAAPAAAPRELQGSNDEAQALTPGAALEATPTLDAAGLGAGEEAALSTVKPSPKAGTAKPQGEIPFVTVELRKRI